MSQVIKASTNTILTNFGVKGLVFNGRRGVVSIAAVNEQPIVKRMNSPGYLKDKLGLETYFVETEGETVTKVAATKKLLEEEQMRARQTLKIPLSQLMKKSNRSYKFSAEKSMKIQMEDL